MNSMPVKKPTRRSNILPRDRALKHLADGRLADAMAWATSGNNRFEDAQDCLAAAKILRAAGDSDSVIELYRHLAHRQPDDRTSQMGLACILAETGRTEALNDQVAVLNAQQPLDALECSMIASASQSGEHLQDAVSWYRAAVDAGEPTPDLQISLAMVEGQLGRKEIAKQLLNDTLQQPLDEATAARAWFNLGVLQEKDKPAQAIEAFRKSLAIQPDYRQPIPNLAILLMGQQALAEAIELLQPVVQNHDDWPRSAVLLASAKRLVGEPDAAVEILTEVSNGSECSPTAWELLVRCHIDNEDVAGAIDTCKQWLKRQPDNSIATHMLAAVQGDQPPARASASYVADTFDSFADSFDSVLANLEYRAPQLVAALVRETLADPTGQLTVLDAGCGTGLAGPYLRDYAKRLIGVDLSENMLEHARRRNTYDELLHADLVEHLQQHADTYDLIVAADTFNYFGDLGDLLTACFGSLKENGWLVFTLEMGDMFGQDYRLESHGRYSHPPQYLMDRLGERGIRGGDIHQPVLRKENGQDVRGMLVAVQKP